jgi:hypothetical protein
MRNHTFAGNGWLNQVPCARPIPPHQWNNHVGYLDVGQPAALVQGAVGNVNGQQNLVFHTQTWQQTQPLYSYPMPAVWGATTTGHFPQAFYPQHWAGNADGDTVNPQYTGLFTPGQVGSPQLAPNHVTALPQNSGNSPQPGANHAAVLPQSINPYHDPQSAPNNAPTLPQIPTNYPQARPIHATALPQNPGTYHEPQPPLYDLPLPDEEWLRQHWNVPF